MKPAYEFGPFRLDSERAVLLRDGQPVPLTQKSFEMLLVLIENRNDTVSKDLLLKTVWPNSFVDEANLTQHISVLRKAFGETPQDRRYIVTVPGRGYRFVAPVREVSTANIHAPIPETSLPDVPVPDENETPSRPEAPSRVPANRGASDLRSRRFLWISASMVLIAAAAGIWMIRSRYGRQPGAKDSVLIAEFENTTGEPVFDGALKQGLAVGLGQSPDLEIVSNDRVLDALRLMGRSPSERVAPPLAREVCQRLQASVLVAGSVSRIGTKYVLAIQAEDCADARILAREQAGVDSREEVLGELGAIASTIRRKLGESQASLKHFDVPLEQATTTSLEALRAYSLGVQQRSQGTERESIPFFEHAIELDRGFAMAYAQLAGAYSNLGETDRAAELLKLAFAMRSKLSERERLFATVQYETRVAGDTEKATSTYEMWARLYPRDWIPLNGLSARYQVVGEYDKAADAASRSITLQPDHYVGYANLASSYLALGRLEDARKACELAASHHRDSIYTHRVLFELAFLNHDDQGMQRQIDWANASERRNDMLANVALAQIARGKLRSGREMFAQSWDALRRAGLSDDAAFSMAGEAVAEADFGKLRDAKKTALAAASIGHGVDARETSAEALALASDLDRADSLAQELHERFPLHRPLNAVSLPTIYATIELQRGNPQKALEILRPALPLDFCEFSSLAAVYIRAQAFLRLGDGKDAATEFRKIIDHPGIAATSQRHPLAHLGLARALVMQGTIAEALKEYQAFLAAWSDADPDIPALIQARNEYKHLQ